MDSNTILSNILQEELQYFYNHIRNYDAERVLATDFCLPTARCRWP